MNLDDARLKLLFKELRLDFAPGIVSCKYCSGRLPEGVCALRVAEKRIKEMKKK